MAFNGILGNSSWRTSKCDEKIVSLLAVHGIKLARRTVAKYRESLNLESSSKRKTK